MEGNGHWSLLLLFAVSFVPLVGVVVYGLFLAGRGRSFFRRELVCPERGTVAECGISRSVDGRLMEIRTCSHLSPPGLVDCAQACLRNAREPEVQDRLLRQFRA